MSTFKGLSIRARLLVLADLGCELGQGYAFSHPVAEAEATALVEGLVAAQAA